MLGLDDLRMLVDCVTLRILKLEERDQSEQSVKLIQQLAKLKEKLLYGTR